MNKLIAGLVLGLVLGGSVAALAAEGLGSGTLETGGYMLWRILAAYHGELPDYRAKIILECE